LPIDRVFSITGFGTVVTGTLSDGEFRIGQEVEISPSQKKARIRGLETHKQEFEVAVPGSRVAVNLSGVNKSEIKRGDVLILPGSYQSTRLFDVHFRLLPEIQQPIKHDQNVKVFVGAAQRMARIRLLGADEISPGQEGWLQLVLDEQILAARGDFFILRRPSPPVTLGGGRIADPHPTGYHKRGDLAVITSLKRYLHGTPEDLIAENLAAMDFVTRERIFQVAGLEREVFTGALDNLLDQGQVCRFQLDSGSGEGVEFLVHMASFERMKKKATNLLKEYHRVNPLRFGMPREEFGSKLGLQPNELNLFLQELDQSGQVKPSNKAIRLAGFEVQITARQEKAVQDLLRRFDSQPYSPPTNKECVAEVGEDLLVYLVESGRLTSVSPEILFQTKTYQEMINKIAGYLEEAGSITVAEVRDLFQTSRKYALPLMEHMDSIGLTVRRGDVRKLKSSGKTS
jgi:selenocysteine-specific elongation factor